MTLGLGKLSNLYAQAMPDVNAPKAVWMAIAFSFASRINGDGGDIANAVQTVRDEWQALYDNKIVPQKPR